jgi:hypothetical protein
MTEAPITTTLKAPGANAPWMVIRSENTPQLNAQLSEIQANGIFAILAAANEAFAAHFTVGGILGAKPLNAPQDTGAFAAPAPAAPAAPTQEELFAQFVAAQNTQGLPTAAPAAAPTAPATAAQYGGGSTPGAPIVAGMPAKLVSGSSAKGPWQAWADPRPKDATDHMQKTDDVNHPGLNAGSHKLWKFIR